MGLEVPDIWVVITVTHYPTYNRTYIYPRTSSVAPRKPTTTALNPKHPRTSQNPNAGAGILRMGFGGGILYYNYNKKPAKPYSNY